MIKKQLLIAVLLFGGIITSVIPVMAGGWATITLDHLPDKVNAGQAYEIGFVVRQHGITPMTGLAPHVVAIHAETGQSFGVDAAPSGAEGHYVASLNFPQSGTWNWLIRAFTMEQPMPPLEVQSMAVEFEVTRSNIPTRVVGFSLGLILVAAASLLFVRKRVKWALALSIAALLFTGGGYALAQNQLQRSASDVSSSLSPIEQGEALFLAKGCITCHNHASVTSKYNVLSGITGPGGSAPDLSFYKANPEFLRIWLADPTYVKPKTYMPDLDLSAEEIESLITFLSVKPDKALATDSKESCPITQPPDPPFVPPSPNTPETPSEGEFWYGTDNLWVLLRVEGTWWGLPYHTHEDGNGHYGQKVVWWNKDYDWQSEERPEFTVTARRLDAPASLYESVEATNAYTPDYGPMILTGVEIPTLGCWEITGEYRGNELSFVVEVVP